MNIKVRDLLYLKNRIEGTYYKVIWDLLYKICVRYGTYFNIVWVQFEENEALNQLKVNTVKGLADLAHLLIDINRYKDNR